jgi:hypothetical protein
MGGARIYGKPIVRTADRRDRAIRSSPMRSPGAGKMNVIVRSVPLFRAERRTDSPEIRGPISERNICLRRESGSACRVRDAQPVCRDNCRGRDDPYGVSSAASTGVNRSSRSGNFGLDVATSRLGCTTAASWRPGGDDYRLSMQDEGRLPGQPSDASLGELENTGWNLGGAAIQMIARLRDHIERLDDGRAYAIDDLAVVLRGLLCSGNGNRVLMRLAQSAGLLMPQVRVSRPAPAEADVFFAVGSIPTEEAGAITDGATDVTLTKWMSLRVLTVQSSGAKVTYTWDRFLSTYAMKWGGVHLDPTVPAHLQMIDGHAAGGLPLSNYLLRTAGVAAWNAAQQMFAEMFADAAVLRDATTGRSVTVGEVARGHRSIYTATGGLTTEPREITSRGLLQAFCHRSGRAELLWYVDPTSVENALHLRLGTVPWDLRYGSPSVPAAQGPIQLQAQRQPDRSGVLEVKPGSLKQIPVEGIVRTLDQVRERAPAPAAVEPD